jgi:uncharacterized membrane protein
MERHLLDSAPVSPAVSSVSSNNGESLPRVRLAFLDGARGTAMLLVLVTHFADTYFINGPSIWARVLSELGRIASPTFMLISGIVIGFMYRARPAHFDDFRVKLVDRGLFLLAIAHPLMAVALWPTLHTTRGVMITDVVAVSMIVAPWFTIWISARSRLAASVLLYSLSWVMVSAWAPQSTFGLVVQETLFGTLTPKIYLFAFPLVPWFSLALAGSAFGEYIAERTTRGNDQLVRLLAMVMVVCVTASVVLKVGYLAAEQAGLLGDPSTAAAVIAHALTARMKTPPSPVYLLFFGGLACGVLAILLAAERSGRFTRVLGYIEVLGRTSLVMFVTQSFVYYTFLHALRPRLTGEALWPLYLILSMLPVIGVALLWHKNDWGRFITIGYSRWRLSEQTA